MQHYFSWWFVDQERDALVNPSTNQQVRYIGKAAAESDLRLVSSEHRFWMRFEYEDPECRYPLLIEWQNQPRSGRQRWRLDYLRSSQLWRREAASSAMHPSYGLWRRVDDTITHALACWPAMDRIGPAPSGICVNGGWHNGAWTDRFYRWFSAVPVARSKKLGSHLAPAPAPLSESPPAPWEFADDVSASGHVVSGWLKGFDKRKLSLEQILAQSDSGGLPAPAFCGSHLRSRDDRRAIIPIGFLSRPGDHEGRTIRLRLLYIDDDLMCDCLSIECKWLRDRSPDPAIWTPSFDSNVSRLRDGAGVVHRRDGLSAQLQSAPSGSSVAHATPRLALWHRLTAALIDAVPNWRTATLALPQAYLKDSPPIDVPAAERVELLRSAGAPGHFLSGFAVTRLVERFEKSSNVTTFESAFEEAPEQPILSARPVNADVGWWSIEAAPKCIRNVESAQCLRLDGVDEVKGWSEATWHFVYRDREIEYPVVVRRKLGPGAFGGTAGTWEIDHAESARLWRVRANRNELLPPYGWWRRVDDAVVDALGCWKQLDELTYDVQIHSTGGWIAGAWDPGWRRRFAGLRGKPSDPAAAIVRPFLEPLNSPAPSAWRFVDHAQDVVRADLAHVRREPGRMPILPAHAPLEGFQGRTPYLIRTDDSAVLFPAFASGRWENSSYPDFQEYYVGVGHFTYANEQAFLTCRFNAEKGIFYTGWQTEFGTRTDGGDTLRLVEEAPGFIPDPAHHPICRSFTFDVLQAWLNWRGSGHRLLEDPATFEALRKSIPPNSMPLPKWDKSGIALEASRSVSVWGGFVGGRYVPNLAVSCDVEASR